MFNMLSSKSYWFCLPQFWSNSSLVFIPIRLAIAMNKCHPQIHIFFTLPAMDMYIEVYLLAIAVGHCYG